MYAHPAIAVSHRNPSAHWAPGTRFAKHDGTAELPTDATSWAAVLDRATNLIWPVNELSEGATHQQALDLASACRLLGQADWQVAHPADFESIISRDHSGPAVHPEFIALMDGHLHNDWHWTSSPDVSAPDFAWYVGLDYGYVGIGDRDGRLRVRVVRSAVPSQ